ncbi:MAG: 4-(cytidine 5'-diphospho)-2-C-methyl-D-erythritol kinase [Candidatus Diapherotrites archaeon]|uniref:4-(cytidine 5'-diphospho)-2-C-methyl-D-erythritol kinase n=1 Tax=Candidatus Iainarchaeum sp. TaxID=3101447 RepID=A0A8T4C5M9_9ARCH|nr:4-(cytidine 5'-diphospho)-2-C-methyl-D-erythritol kinase [Candidatus Diapherotrites archaeon]
MPSSLTLSSPAKLTLVLDIIRKREDGYHEVELVLQELAIHDTITIEALPHSSEIILSCTDASVPLNEKNSCHKATILMQNEFASQNPGKPIQGVKIHIDKKIPSAGGLGGGSSNSATVLKGLNELWQLNLSKNVLKNLGAKIGSDEVFLIEGGTCIGLGRGEIVEPIEKCPRLELAIITPPVKVPEKKSAWVYGHFDVNKVSHHYSIHEMRKAIRSNDPQKVAEKMGNVFETLELLEYAVVFALIEGLKQMSGVRTSMLAGAGPTVVCVCDSQRTASQIIEPFRARGWVAFTTHTV